MDAPELNVVTGAFGYTGRHIARRLLELGVRVKTLTGHPRGADPLAAQVKAEPFRFDDPAGLAASLRGATTLYNTYWVRFPRGRVTFETAIANTETLFRAAREAGVRRVVHVSIANPSEDSPFAYYRGKAALERSLLESGLSHAILRPTVVFGPGDILINNIAWFLRRAPFFAVPGAGDYEVQPVFVEDLAELAVRAGRSEENLVADAVGPEVYTFVELVRRIAGAMGRPARIVRVRPGLARLLLWAMGPVVRDVVLTREEIEALMSSLLVSKGPPSGSTRLSEWLDRNAAALGTRYASELGRHYR
ncbi:MAG: NAD(P)H-binding protein [Planctomycetes bacterium]|nr:NAD(P)H-binding protein [Planctomycetota bacterium]